MVHHLYECEVSVTLQYKATAYIRVVASLFLAASPMTELIPNLLITAEWGVSERIVLRPAQQIFQRQVFPGNYLHW